MLTRKQKALCNISRSSVPEGKDRRTRIRIGKKASLNEGGLIAFKKCPKPHHYHPEEWIFKQYVDDRLALFNEKNLAMAENQLAQIEAGVSEFMRFLMATPDTADRACKVRAVINTYDNGKACGVLIKKFSNFVSFYDWIKKSGKFSNAELINYKFASLVTASLAMQEIDLSVNNYGVIPGTTPKLVRIDFDRSCASYTLVKNYEIKNQQGEYEPLNIEHVTVEDLEHILTLPSLKVDAWPILDAKFFKDGEEGLKKLEDNQDFRLDKWQTLLRLFLLDKNKIHQIWADHVSNPKLINKLTTLLDNFYTTIKNEMVKSADLYNLIITQGDYFSTYIINSVSNYNSTTYKNKNLYIPVDKDIIAKIFDLIKSTHKPSPVITPSPLLPPHELRRPPTFFQPAPPSLPTPPLNFWQRCLRFLE